MVIGASNGIVNLRSKDVVHLEELELRVGVGVEGSGGWVRCCLEGFNILMRVALNHPVDSRVLTPLYLYILSRLGGPSRKGDVKGDIVDAFIQDEAFQHCAEPIIVPSNTLVSILPFISLLIRARVSWCLFSSSVSLYLLGFLVWQSGMGDG